MQEARTIFRESNGLSSERNNGTDIASLVQKSDFGEFSLDGYEVSLDDYWTYVYDQTEGFYEWNNGILEEKPPMTHVVLTGRNAKEELIEIADLVTEMELKKHPFRSGIKAQIGVEY